MDCYFFFFENGIAKMKTKMINYVKFNIKQPDNQNNERKYKVNTKQNSDLNRYLL